MKYDHYCLGKITIAKDGFPLELIEGRPITNFFRRLFLASHTECKICYERRTGIRVAKEPNLFGGGQ